MSYLTKLVLFMLLNLVNSRPQLNLHLTYWVSNIENNHNVVQHDCLHVPVLMPSFIHYQHTNSYCMNEWPSKWNIEENRFDQKFTFTQLAELNITSEQLFIWSAPIDIIERYQSYLINQSLTSKEISPLATESFYNCTPPTFGPFCQYSLDGYEYNDSSLEDILDDYYSYKYPPARLTCYDLLECNIGMTRMCLDWRNICDGQIDCFANGVDEEHCWELEANECKDNEYRCTDGHCIPKTFIEKGVFSFDCLDWSDSVDRTAIDHIAAKQMEPTFKNEDSRCAPYTQSRVPIISICASDERPTHILEEMFSDKSKNTSDDCWLAFRCHFNIPYLSDLRCGNMCTTGNCQNIIETTCPDMLFIPNVPILFGHIYLAYTKKDAVQAMNWKLPPSYICYNDQLCGGFLSNKTLISFNNMTCRRPSDFPVRFDRSARGNWMDGYVKPIHTQLNNCNTIPQTIASVCNNSRMYRCVNSSKCILNNRVGDENSDCDYGDDEQQDVINRVCLNDRSELFFNCTTTQKCINRKKLGNYICNCGLNQYDMCDDKNLDKYHIVKHISFPSICDGFTELIPVNISGEYETDETGCELWPCNNTYTRCDGYWNCPDGADEVDCDSSPLINCPLQHICITPNMSQLICLSLTRVNDGEIDCLGTMDEPSLCRSNDATDKRISFRCETNNFNFCTRSQYTCDEIQKCLQYDGYWFCTSSQNITIFIDNCEPSNETILSNIDRYICAHRLDRSKQLELKFFSLNTDKNSTEDVDPTHPSPSIAGEVQRCQRGFPLRVWLNKEQNITNTTCLCPPSFYGDTCQYQNQRVSLTLKLMTYSDSRRTPFAILVKLIDNDDERTVHSYYQFTYLYIRDCKTKFDIYLLYSNRPKNNTKQYSIHIDIYEKTEFTHRGSFLVPVKFLFLPIQRIAAQINIPHTEQPIEYCSNLPCVHGQCLNYTNDLNKSTFCQCAEGWTGKYCNIQHNCSCSSGSRCAGISSNNRSICVCPMHKFGPRCLLHNTICQSNVNEICINGGICIPLDENIASNKKFFCICPKSFIGDRCEIASSKIMVSFHENITLPQSMVIHFIQVMKNDIPNNGSTFATISINNKSAIIYWSNPFHIVLIKLFKNDYYLMIVQKIYNESITMHRTINPSDRCVHINETLNENITQLELIRRIKYYHVPCQNRSLLLSCFYDDTHLCLCDDFGQQRLANCFEFNYTKKYDCFGESGCLNGAECLQDKLNCPSISACMCLNCFYGAQCQFSSDGFDLSLDGILGYHIQPHINIVYQPFIIQFSIILIIIMTIAGLIDGILSTITFSSGSLRRVGCGLYLLGSSINTLSLTIMFALKFLILMIAQINYISNEPFLTVQCYSINFLLRVGLNMNHWLNACVAIERAITSVQGIRFNKTKSKTMAKYIIIFLIFFTISTAIHDPIHRQLHREVDDSKEKRIWCIVEYSSGLHTFNSSMNILHFFAPSIIDILSAVIIISKTTRQRKIIHKQESYKDILFKQIGRHRNLLIAPFVLITLAIPRVIISFVSGCMKSSDDAWLFLIGYLISFIPSMLTFVVFVLPSKSYKDVFLMNMKRYRTNIRRCLRIGLFRIVAE